MISKAIITAKNLRIFEGATYDVFENYDHPSLLVVKTRSRFPSYKSPMNFVPKALFPPIQFPIHKNAVASHDLYFWGIFCNKKIKKITWGDQMTVSCIMVKNLRSGDCLKLNSITIAHVNFSTMKDIDKLTALQREVTGFGFQKLRIYRNRDYDYAFTRQ